MRLKEFRVFLPLTVAEYQVGQLYGVAKASKKETTKKGDGVEILQNEPFENEKETGQYTRKIYHIGNRVPGWIRMLCPKSLLQLHEEAWNAYPHCKTVLTSPFFKNKLQIVVETHHEPDCGTQENVHELSEEDLKIREVEYLDIAMDEVEKKDYREDEDPQLVKSEKTNRGVLTEEGWQKNHEPIMCCYKLVTAEFKQWGFQSRVENHILKSQRGLFLRFHKQVFCWMDEWIEMTMEDIRRLEDQTKDELAARHHSEEEEKEHHSEEEEKEHHSEEEEKEHHSEEEEKKEHHSEEKKETDDN